MSKFYLVLFLLFFLITKAGAQCPIANSCSPGTAPASNHVFGMGIYNVSVGSGTTGFTNPTTGGSSDGYQNYSCTKKATLLEGVPTSISITTNPNVNENVKVWIDLNNNGSFDATSELMFNSINAKAHTGTITIPASASVIKNQVLRMRVSADNFSSPIPTPCSTPAYSQVEDYGITVIPNTSKPLVNFSVPNPTICSPTVQFTNQVQNGATSYFWSFGDNSTSTLANPSHTYAATGTYTIKLKACNTNGCDSLTKTNYINYHTTIPVAASCTPATTNYCCGYGITKVTLHTMVNSSQDASAGYEDFTCTKSIAVEEGLSHPISIETSPVNNQNTWVYIDYSNNGSFELNELVFSGLNQVNPSGQILIPTGLQLNLPRRMRVISDAIGRVASPCANTSQGQAEDYTVIIIANTRKPLAYFNQNKVLACGAVQFTDTSKFAPTSWSWNFGDLGSGSSNTSTLQSPSHTFSGPGNYTITQIACNTFGCDTLIKNNLITVPAVATMLPASCTPQTLAYCCGHGIFGIEFTGGAINFSSGNGSEGYQDYSCSTNAIVKFSDLQTITLYLFLNDKAKVWIDYNNNGIFEASELIMTYNGYPDPRTVSFRFPSNVVKNTYLRMRVISDAGQYPILGPCNNVQNGQAEDYAIKIIDPPVADFSRSQNCTGIIAFADSSKSNPASWLWNFGDPVSGSANNSTLQNPTHTFASPGTYRVTLKACNSFGCDSISKDLVIGINPNINLSPTCFPRVTNPIFNSSITNFSLAGINNTTSASNTTGLKEDPYKEYKDYSCARNTLLVAGQSYPISISTVYQTSFSDVNMQVWIDYNNDNVFNSSERVFHSLNGGLHAGTITIPTSTVKNQYLRLRVRAEDTISFQSRIPGPCTLGHRGETEDYAVMVVNQIGTKEVEFADKVLVYPNPSEGIFTLELPATVRGTFQLEVQDLVGKSLTFPKVENQVSGTRQVDLSHLPKGVYLLRFSNDQGSTIKKVIIE